MSVTDMLSFESAVSIAPCTSANTLTLMNTAISAGPQSCHSQMFKTVVSKPSHGKGHYVDKN